MVFDTKINNENLTKCLQTLKELYHDLEEAGVKCENEHEFRAYMVLRVASTLMMSPVRKRTSGWHSRAR